LNEPDLEEEDMRILARLTIALASLASVPALAADPGMKEAILYKNPNCGCCEGYADYLRQNGYTVIVKNSANLALINRQYGVPDQLESCHTALIDGYVIEGHVPIEFVSRLLSERPAIRGISIPDMPVGLPGMEGDKEGPITVYEFSDGQPAVYGTVE
jgi:hypothetical protein